MQPLHAKPTRFATIKDIAQSLGLSVATVSRALRGLPEVRPETRQRVMELARSLNYRPNQAASNLATQHSHLIGVVVPQLTNHFFANILSAIQTLASQAEYRVVICECGHTRQRERLDVEALLSLRIDGLIAIPIDEGDPLDAYGLVHRQGIPLVFIDRKVDTLDVPTVLVDDFVAARNATQHLIEAGARHIAHITTRDPILPCHKRRAGYRSALEAAGIPFRPELIGWGEFTVEAGRQTMTDLLAVEPRIDAVFGIDDRVAAGAVLAIKASGRRVPGDVRVIGFSDNPIGHVMDPPLSTVDQPGLEMGRIAAQLLLDQIEGQEVGGIHMLPTRLIVRPSSAGVPTQPVAPVS
ncbi:MAG: LacI family DNA-binding transcriptional regulator [Bacteroidia bacterium]